MTAVRESPVWIDCEGAAMLGVLARPPQRAAGPDNESKQVGVLIVVGGPQYRVGSHRQFTLLARRLAAAGFPTLRFDYRGMGDSQGEPRDFTEIEADIAAATAALRKHAGVSEVVMWGLCDAASALLLAVGAGQRADGLVLVNPWVSSEASHGATRLKHYYTRRFLNLDFWKKLLAGGVDWKDSVRSLTHSLSAALGRTPRGTLNDRATAAPFQERMAKALRSFDRPVLIALSGKDYTAREFEAHAAHDVQWRGLLDGVRIKTVLLDEAYHTFAGAKAQGWLEEQTLGWLEHSSLTGGSGITGHS
jgi:uncharacterized protein